MSVEKEVLRYIIYVKNVVQQCTHNVLFSKVKVAIMKNGQFQETNRYMNILFVYDFNTNIKKIYMLT